MKNDRINFYDAFTLCALLCILFTVGYNLGTENQQSEKSLLTFEIAAQNVTGAPLYEQELMIDEKYPCFIISESEGVYKVLVEGEMTGAGFLISKSKHLSPNQPISAYGKESGIEGKILRFCDIRENYDSFS